MDREKTMKMEVETVEKDCDSIKEQVLLLETPQGLTELANAKLGSELEKSRRKCEELEETITRLIEEQRVSSDREKRAKERYDKVLENNSKMKSKKDKIICELNEEINELGNKNLENELLVRVYKEKLQSVVHEIKNLRHEKMVAEQTVNELRIKISESDKATGVKNEGMFENKIIHELNEKINELTNKNTENERLVLAVYQEKFQFLEANKKLKGRLTELKKLFSSSVAEKEELSGRYKTLVEDHKKLDSKLMKTFSRAIEQARSYTQAQQQVDDQTLDELRLKKRSENLVPSITKQNRSKGLQGSGPHATDMGKIASAQTKKKQYRTHGGFPIRLSPKKKRRKYISDDDDDDDDDILPTDEKINPVLQSDTEDKTFSPDPNLPYYSTCQSIITPDHVQKLRKSMGIPPEYEIIILSPEVRPNHPPPGFLCFFTQQLEGGLRFPIPPLFSEISCLFNISLCQLTPNSFRLMAGFAMAVSHLGEIPTARLFHSYYNLLYKSEGYFYFSSRGEARFLKGYPRSMAKWKEQYFFISCPQGWNFPTIWRVSLPKAEKNDVPSKSLLDRLNQNPYDISRLVEPSLLYHFGLSPLREKLLKPIEEIMAGHQMKEEAARLALAAEEGRTLGG